MNFKRITSFVLVIAGAAALGLGFYINQQIEEGKKTISTAQQHVDQGNTLFSLTPETAVIGKELTAPVTKKIEEGQAQISQYEQVVYWMRMGGIIVATLGALILFMSFKGKKTVRRGR